MFTESLPPKYRRYIGHVVSAYAGYSIDTEVRNAASSGGIVSGILIHLLETKKIDGALVSKIVSKNGKLSAETIIATSREEILDSAGSSYVDIPIITAVKRIKEFSGRIAVVSVPCYISALERMCQRDAELNSKISCKIGLFCGGNVKFSLYEMVLKQHNIHEADVERIFFRRSHVTGDMIVTMRFGEQLTIPFHHFNVYRILGYHRKPYCIQCDDYTSETADLSVGDTFFKGYKDRDVKHSLVLCRNESGESILQQMIDTDKVQVEELILLDR